MSWLAYAISAYLILAIVNLADKFLLEKAMPSTKGYTFLISIVGAAVLLAYPWFGSWPGWRLLGVDILVGAIFPLGLLLMYQALKTGDASKILVIVGGSTPIFTLSLSYVFLGERFTAHQWMALAGLIAGTSLIAWLPSKETWLSRLGHFFGFQKPEQAIGLAEAIGAAVLFSIFMVASKYLYTAQGFTGAFIWLRLGSALAGLSLLLSRNNRREIFKAISRLKGQKAAIFWGNQMLAAIGFTLQSYAQNLGSVAIVNAMQGFQYTILLILGAILSVFAPRIIKENISKAIIIQKIIAVILISLSLYILSIG